MSIDIEYLKTWVGREEQTDDEINLFPAQALNAALDRNVTLKHGDELPLFWEWLYFLPTPRADATGADGHPDKGGFLPPVPLPRRMWAAGECERFNSLIIGKPASRRSTIESVELKEGSSGTLVFVNVRHEYVQEGVTCLSQVQNIVYREQPTEAVALPPGKPASDQVDFSEELKVDPVMLFRYSALTYNGHRIHYDRDYAVNQELYPALVVHGPLLVTLLLNLKDKHLADKKIKSFKFRAMRPTFDTNVLTLSGASGSENSDDKNGSSLELWSSDHEKFQCMSIKCRLDV